MTKDIEFVNFLEDIDHIDDLKSIDIVYEYLDPIIDSKDFDRVMDIIEMIITKQFSLRVLIAVLTITHTQKNKLGNRQKIIDTIRQNNRLTKNQIESLLKGF